MDTLKLIMVLVGCKPAGRHTEQHDVYFGIAGSVAGIVPQLKAFWPEAAETMHIDAFRLIGQVNGYEVRVVKAGEKIQSNVALYFINLGGYKPGEPEEFHYKMIIAATDKGTAVQQAKQTAFYKHTGFAGAASHLDDKYGVDVDDVSLIEEILPDHLKTQFAINLVPAVQLQNDKLHLGYFKLSKIASGDYDRPA